MNGLEVYNSVKWESGREEIDCHKTFYSKKMNIIYKELKVNQILKEKKVNLQFISYKLSIGYSAQELLEEYNAFDVLNNLTLEEMQSIVDWLKEDK